MLTTSQDLYDLLAPRASNGAEAFRLIDELFTGIIVALRRDRRFVSVKLIEFELLLADQRRDTTDRWLNLLHDRLDLHDTVNIIAQRILGEDD
jgi:hypothetical protein